ncbi:MAG: thiamine phosphate synthase [Halothiobacillaceae bacterium]|nr:thiamine phosphate synthase [Halothiobacillaceae bacterium]
MRLDKSVNQTKLWGLYVITDTVSTQRTALVQAVGQAIKGGARIVQYRDKSADFERRLAEASALRALTLAHNVLFLINDDVALALAVGADGVHLGREDGAIAAARFKLGAGALIGASCYNDFALAEQAARAGADYVAFGAFYPSKTKPHAVPATPALLARARAELHVPLCAIGGITPENAPPLLAAGADMLAVISAVFAAQDIPAAAHAFAALMSDKN